MEVKEQYQAKILNMCADLGDLDSLEEEEEEDDDDDGDDDNDDDISKAWES
jgi:hypothetical protein